MRQKMMTSICKSCSLRQLRPTPLSGVLRSTKYISTARLISSQPHLRSAATARSHTFKRNIATQSPASSSTIPPPQIKAQPQSQKIPPTRTLLNPRYSAENEELLVSITPRAAHKLNSLIKAENNPQLCLRIQVESGGCHGFQYILSLTSTSELDLEEDTLFALANDQNAQGIQGSEKDLGNGIPKIAMDQATLDLLSGSKVDYAMELIGSQFKVVDNPRATSSCGCGTSFDLKGNEGGAWGL